MSTNRDNSEYQVPTFRKREAYNFVSDASSLDIYKELSQIAEEIERCRLRNC
ncbi:hypothetical protein IJI28_00115 [Candidatus Saccharibacteria bacterium]|nr:hypothetical protein [Candidatus Saccharibacteria bacterium]